MPPGIAQEKAMYKVYSNKNCYRHPWLLLVLRQLIASEGWQPGARISMMFPHVVSLFVVEVGFACV